MVEWYVRKNKDAPKGPLTLEQALIMVRHGRLRPSDSAWHAGMAKWLPIHSIPEMTSGAPRAVALSEAGNIVKPDEGPFYHVSGQFFLNGAQWKSRIIASPQAFYLSKVKRYRNNYGFAGDLFVLAVMGKSADDPAHDDHTCVVAKLPDAVRSQLNPTGGASDTPVLVIPRTAISFVATSVLQTRIGLRLGDLVITIATTPIGAGSAHKFLESNGWKLNQELYPTSFLDIRRPKRLSMKVRLLCLAGAIAIICAVLLLTGRR